MEAAGAAAAEDAGVPSEEPDAKASEEQEEEEEGECPFCLFMKAGPCGKEFGDWEQCVEEAEKGTDEVVVRCRSITQSLMKCMEGFTDYYGVVLQAGEKLGQQEDNVVEHADGSNSSSNRESTKKHQKAESTEKDENTEKNTGEDQKGDSTEKDPKAGLQVQIQVEDRKELAA